MSENVIGFSGTTTVDLSPEMILLRAAEAGLTRVLVLGWEDGKVLYAASSTSDRGANLELCETFKFQMLSGEYTK